MLTRSVFALTVGLLALLPACTQTHHTPLTFLQAYSAPQRDLLIVDAPAIHQLLQSNPNGYYKILDVRTREEFSQGHLANAHSLDYFAPAFRQELAQFDRHQPYIVYCRSGNRSGKTLNIMRELGFKDARDMQGGILAWQANGFPLSLP